MGEDQNGCAMPLPRTRWQRLLSFLFPEDHMPYHEQDEDGEVPYYPHGVQITFYAGMSLQDRLRILISGKLVIKCNVMTDVEVAEAYTASTISVIHPWHPMHS